MMVALISGEHPASAGLACSSRQPAANISGLSWVNCAKMRSASCRMLRAGSLRSPDFSRRDSSAEIKNGHAHGQTVGNLIENDAACSVGDFAVDLDAAIDRPRMHDQAIRLQQFRPLLGQAKQRGVFDNAGKVFFALTFVLDAQKIYNVGIREDIVDLVRNADAEFLELARHQRAGANQCDARAKFEQTKNVRARHATEQNVSDDDDVELVDLFSLFTNRVKIEQPLGGMFVSAVTGIDDARLQSLG